MTKDTPLTRIIKLFPDKNWCWYRLFQNPNITEFIWKNPFLPLLESEDNFRSFPWEIPLHPNLTWEFIRDNSYIDWEWFAISQNPIITWDIIISNPEKPWDWKGISRNPNITFEIIRDNPSLPWSWWDMSYNLFNYHSFFQSNNYRKRMTKNMHDTIHEELISKACHPDRIMNWNEDFYMDYCK